VPSAASPAFCGNNVAVFEDEFEPELDDRFVAEFVVRSVAESAAVFTVI
jgi:hypothetical protein